MVTINVTAKVNGYHPASGLYLIEGDNYSIDEEDFSEEVFTRVEEVQPPAPDNTKGGAV